MTSGVRIERHGIVVPGVGTLQQCGGPAFCATCNAEMIELETIAIGCAQRYEDRMGRGYDHPDMLTRRWQSPSYVRKFRQKALALVRLKVKNEALAAGAKVRKTAYDQKRRADEAIVARKNELARIRRATPEEKAKRRLRDQLRLAREREHEQRRRDRRHVEGGREEPGGARVAG